MKLYKRKTGRKNLQEQIEKLKKENQDFIHELSQLQPLNYLLQKEDFVLNIIIDLENIGYSIIKHNDNNLSLSKNAKKILWVNPGFESIKIDDFLNLILSEDKPGVEKILRDKTIARKTNEFSFKIVKPDQDREIKQIHSKIKVFENRGKNILLFTIADVTTNEKLKKDLIRAKEKAEETDKLKNIFLSNVSHEIRIPLNSIVGFAELLNIGNLTSDERKEYVQIIKNQSGQLTKLIDDISEISKFEAGEIKINKIPCNLNLLLNELLLHFNQQKKIQKKDHIELKLNIPNKKGLVTYTDSGRLQQLLTNLISNAIKFTEKGFVEFGYNQEENGYIEFYVKDTGIGLNKEQQKHIFDRFKYAEETITRKYEGTGLGLSIVKGITKLLGGKIWIESEPEKGSTFYFDIPFEQVPEEDMEKIIYEESKTKEYTWKNKFILIAEDDDVNYRFIETVLLENQAQVLRASNGHQVIQLCKSINKIDLVLMDIKMPEMDGFEATRQIRQFNQSIPIIALTAFALEDDKDKCLNAGCNDLISKPIEIEELHQKINQYFSS